MEYIPWVTDDEQNQVIKTFVFLLDSSVIYIHVHFKKMYLLAITKGY